MAKKLRLKVGDRVRLRGGSEYATVFANPYMFRGERRVGVIWDHQLGHVLTVEVSRLVKAAARGCVPLEARPVSVGALQHPARLYLDRHSLSEPCNVCSAKAGEPCVNLLTSAVLLGTHAQAPGALS